MALAVSISLGSQYGTTSVSPQVPANLAVNDVLVLFISGKDHGFTVTMPTGWTQRGTIKSGTTASTTTLGTGDTAIYVFTKVVTATTETIPTITATGSNTLAARCYSVRADPGSTLSYGFAGGADITDGTAISVTHTTNPGIAPGDLVIEWLAARASSTGAMGTISGMTMTVPGMTAFSIAGGASTGTTGTGRAIGTRGYHAFVAANGGTSTGNPVFTATSNQTTGLILAGALLRIRETLAPSANKAGTETPTVSVTETETVQTLTSRTDSPTVSLDDVSTLESQTSRTDTLALAVTETSTVQITQEATPINTTDTLAIALTESSTIQSVTQATGSDNPTLSVTESSSVQVFVSGSDSPTLSTAETRTESVSTSRADGPRVTLTDTSNTGVSLTREDSVAIGLVETSNLQVQVSSQDSPGLILSDFASSLVSTDGNDVLEISTIDNSITEKKDVIVVIEKTGSDSLGLSLDETSVISISAQKVGTDTISLAITEVAGVDTETKQDETINLVIEDSSQTTVYIETSDDLTLLVTETGEAVEPFREISTTDNISLFVNETRIIVNQFQRIDIILGRKRVDVVNSVKTTDSVVSRKRQDVGNPIKQSDVVLERTQSNPIVVGGN